MPFNISNYKENIKKFGYTKPSKYTVIIPPPPILGNITAGSGTSQSSTDISRDLLYFRAEQVRVPGVTIDYVENRMYGIGPTQKMPWNVKYTDTTASFLLDNKALIHSFWYQWINATFNFAGRDSSGGNSLPAYQVQYKNQYAVKMSIKQFDDYGRLMQTINLYDTYPIYMNNLDLNWSAKNQTAKLGIGLNFKEFTIEKSANG